MSYCDISYTYNARVWPQNIWIKICWYVSYTFKKCQSTVVSSMNTNNATHKRYVLLFIILQTAPVAEAGQTIFFAVYEHTNLSWLPVTTPRHDAVQTPGNICCTDSHICKLNYNMAAVIRKP
jgi:hypothetical protein